MINEEIKKLKYAIQTSNFYSKGSFRYKSCTPKKENDLSAEYKKIEFDGNYIEIYNVKEIAKNVKVKGEYEVSYSSTTEQTFETRLTFEELKESEYWEDIVKRYPFNETKYNIYKKDEIYIDDKTVEMTIYSDTQSLTVRFDRYDKEINIYSLQNKDVDFSGKLYELVVTDNKQNYENEMCKKLVSLMKNHKIEVLSNGFVIDNTYYEDIDDFEEKESE